MDVDVFLLVHNNTVKNKP